MRDEIARADSSDRESILIECEGRGEASGKRKKKMQLKKKRLRANFFDSRNFYSHSRTRTTRIAFSREPRIFSVEPVKIQHFSNGEISNRLSSDTLRSRNYAGRSGRSGSKPIDSAGDKLHLARFIFSILSTSLALALALSSLSSSAPHPAVFAIPDTIDLPLPVLPSNF